jgi:hypothetical protein
MKTYKVLWIDDEFQKLEPFSKLAGVNNIKLDGFKSYEEGFANFEKKLFEYDAIILDALFFKSGTQVSGSEDLKGLSAAKDKIAEFKKQRTIPFFILSGQTKLENNEVFSDTYGNHYRKQNPEDVKKLFVDLKEASDNEPYTKLRHKYENVFSVCTDKYISEEASKHLVEVLYSIEYPADKFDDEKYFNGLRKVVEHVFRAANRIGILHDGCIPDGFVNLTWSSLFLAGKELELKPTTKRISSSKGYFPSILANNIKNALDITSAASHTEGEEKEHAKVNVTDYKKEISSNYLLYSLAYQIMDLVLWFKKVYDENPDAAKNKLFWAEHSAVVSTGEWAKGTVVRIAENGFGTFQNSADRSNLSVLPAMVTTNTLKVGDRIEVRTKMDAAGSKLLIAELRKV